ncbi:MAG: T9SS type A sorting domain-containing protein [Bacteroidetes bacterium]|nr:T9SS type A sorting domain-containing protein [Bacteroidota bacterium]MCW5895999.1 T9SS type A sorting domain-containing protein [Bacteroidota bacterium]
MNQRLAILILTIHSVAFAQPANNPDIQLFPSTSHQFNPRIAVSWANENNLMAVLSLGTWAFSTNGGENWSGGEAAPPPIGNSFGGASCFFDVNGRAYYIALGNPGGIYVVSTTDVGATWSARTNADPLNSNFNDAAHASADPSGTNPNNVYAAWTDFNVSGSPVVFTRSINNGATWSARTTLAIGSNRGQGAYVAVGPTGEVYVAWAHYTTGTAEVGIGFVRSTDAGATFNTPAVAFPISGLRTSNAGLAAFNGARAHSFPHLDVDRSTGPRRGWLYVVYPDRSLGQSNVYIRRSTDGGTTWSDTIQVSNLPLSPEKQQWLPAIGVDQTTGDITVTYSSMDSVGSNFFTNRYAARSTDGGDTWERWVISDVRTIYGAIGMPGGQTFPSTNSEVATLRGKAWAAWTDTRTGTSQAWLERINYSQTFVDGNERSSPMQFALYQNYPNPFNPTTNIEFRIANREFVSLKVFDVLGREVGTLVNNVENQGEYSVQFNARGLASGVYYYQLRSGSFVSTKKMILIR